MQQLEHYQLAASCQNPRYSTIGRPGRGLYHNHPHLHAGHPHAAAAASNSPVRSVVIVAPGDPIPPNLPPQQKLQLQQMSSDHPPPPMQATEAAAAATADSAAFAMASHRHCDANHEMFYG